METELKKIELQGGLVNQKPTVNTSLGKPSLPALNLSTDHVDLYFERFERHCASMKWPKEDWPSCFVNLLSGEALTIFLSLDSEESNYYDKVKETLLVHLDCTESGFRSKFMQAKPALDENFDTFLNRVKRYFDQWTRLAGAHDFESLSFLVLKERILDCCNNEFSAYIKDKQPSSANDLKKFANAFKEARLNKSFVK